MSLQLLTIFFRGYPTKRKDPVTGNIEIVVNKIERVRCYIWFSNGKEMLEFVKKHSPYPPPFDKHTGKFKKMNWKPYTTIEE